MTDQEIQDREIAFKLKVEEICKYVNDLCIEYSVYKKEINEHLTIYKIPGTRITKECMLDYNMFNYIKTKEFNMGFYNPYEDLWIINKNE